MDGRHVNILGAGQCGTLLAIMLARKGYSIDLYERNVDPRGEFAAAGRSINLVVTARGFNALEKAGVLARVEPLLVPMRGRMIHAVDESTEFLPYGQRESEQIHSASRGELNKILLDAAEDIGNVDIHFGQAAIGYNAETRRAQILDVEANCEYEVEAQPLIAADGAGSVIRNALQEADIIGATMSPLLHGYKELEIPAGPGGKFQLDPSALHIWPRGGFMLIALPNPGGDFTLTLFLANEGETSFAALNNKQAATAFFEDYFPDVVALIQDAAHAIVTNPLGFLGTVRCRSWHDDGNVLLLGDAAHAVVPFHGQGMNLAFEDCVVLDRNLDAPDADWQDIFRKYENEQLANANAIADMALENYVEMRDTVRDPKFALRKELAFELERRLPDRFIPRYSMVMFHADIPYRVAKDRGEIQQRLLEQLSSDAEHIDQIDLEAAVATVVEQLDPVNGGKA
jgi:kynurenine 3-monooxygenase